MLGSLVGHAERRGAIGSNLLGLSWVMLLQEWSPFPFGEQASLSYETAWLHTPNSLFHYRVLWRFQVLIVSVILHFLRLWEWEYVSG